MLWCRCPWPDMKLSPETCNVLPGVFHLFASPSLSVVLPSIGTLSLLLEINSSLHLAPAFREVDQLSSPPPHWHTKVCILGKWILAAELSYENVFLLIDWIPALRTFHSTSHLGMRRAPRSPEQWHFALLPWREGDTRHGRKQYEMSNPSHLFKYLKDTIQELTNRFYVLTSERPPSAVCLGNLGKRTS